MTDAYDGRDMVEVPEDDLYDVYSTLVDATNAAATGDRNECARLASEAKDDLSALYEEYA